MCGRFALEKIDMTLGEAFDIPVPEVAPRYNIAPSQTVMAVRRIETKPEMTLPVEGFVKILYKNQ
jgi:putative SOS response-associated peptidase YedK